MDAKLSPAQADPRHDGNVVSSGDVVVLAPKDWTDAEAALCKLAHIASDRRRPPPASDFSAGPRVTEPSPDATLRVTDLKNDRSPTDRLPPGRRASRGLARFLMTACIGVAATLAWQSYGDTAKQMIASAAPQLGWLVPAMDPPSDREIAVGQPSPSAVQVPALQAASAQAGAVAPPSETAGSNAPVAPSPELQQLETMAHDLAAVQQSVEQLAAGQEQMARDIAKLQTAEQDIRRRIAAPPSAAATTMRKPAPPPPAVPQSSAALLPPVPPQPAPQPSAAPLPPPLEPPRPPMPVR